MSLCPSAAKGLAGRACSSPAESRLLSVPGQEQTASLGARSWGREVCSAQEGGEKPLSGHGWISRYAGPPAAWGRSPQRRLRAGL